MPPGALRLSYGPHVTQRAVSRGHASPGGSIQQLPQGKSNPRNVALAPLRLHGTCHNGVKLHWSELAAQHLPQPQPCIGVLEGPVRVSWSAAQGNQVIDQGKEDTQAPPRSRNSIFIQKQAGWERRYSKEVLSREGRREMVGVGAPLKESTCFLSSRTVGQKPRGPQR